MRYDAYALSQPRLQVVDGAVEIQLIYGPLADLHVHLEIANAEIVAAFDADTEAPIDPASITHFDYNRAMEALQPDPLEP